MTCLKNTLNYNGKRRILGIIITVTAIVFTVFMYIYAGIPMIKFVKQPELFRTWVNSHGILGRVAFIGMVVFQIIVAIIPGEPLEIAAGYAFGAVEGTILCLIGTFLGSVLVFLLARKFGMSFISLFINPEKVKNLKFLKTSKKRDVIIFFLFSVPGTPKDVLSYAAGIIDINFGYWLFLCSVGRFPSVISSTIGGSMINRGNYWGAVLVFGITFAVSLFGLAVYNKFCKNNKNQSL